MKYVLYNHIGSANHGCEALVRTISDVFGPENVVLLTEAIEEEKRYGICDLLEVKPAMSKQHSPFEFLKAFAALKIKNNYFPLDILPYQNAIKKFTHKDDVMVSIGGDIYCYDNYPKYILLHSFAKRYVKKSILLGCSIEPSSLCDSNLINDLRSYDVISARETITYHALIKAGLDNVILCPDTAFGMIPEKIPLPDHFEAGNTVGLNISPLVLKKSANSALIMENYCRVIEHILSNTPYAVALIPHVAWENNDDSMPLTQFFQKYSGSNRVCILDDLPAPQIKYVISKCRFFIGARTHATIAAYSTGVPTLVLGYSIKSKGIARDLFGTEENYVLDYKSISDDKAILRGFQWLEKQEENIKVILSEKNPQILAALSQLKETIVNRLN